MGSRPPATASPDSDNGSPAPARGSAWYRHSARVVLVSMLVLAASVAPSQPRPTRVTIAWDANPEPTVAGYLVYIGSEPGNYRETQDVGNVTSFAYADAVEGRRYYFAVAAYAEGNLVGPQSSEITAVAGSRDSSSAASPASALLTPSPTATHARRASRLSEVTSLAALPDGRLLVAGPSSISVIDGEGLVHARALAIGPPDARLTDVVVDPHFNRTRQVFVGVVETRRDGGREFRVSRYREIGNTLGEGAVIIAGLAVHGPFDPAFAIDQQEHVYIAMPGSASARIDPYAGRILRFNADGTVPRDAGSRSPVLVAGDETPSGLSWDGQNVWASGRGSTWPQSLKKLTTDSSESRAWQPIPAPTSSDTDVLAAEVVAFDVAADADARSLLVVFLDTARRLHHVRVRGNEVVHLMTGDFGDESVPVALSIGPQLNVFVAVRTREGFDVVQARGRNDGQ